MSINLNHQTNSLNSTTGLIAILNAAAGGTFTAVPYAILGEYPLGYDADNFNGINGRSFFCTINLGGATEELRGIVAGASGEAHIVVNTSGTLTVVHNSGSATGKKIFCHGATNISVPAQSMVLFWFDPVADVWRAR